MRCLEVSIAAIAVAGVVVACSAHSSNEEEQSARTSAAVRTVTEEPGSPGCPEGTTLLCRISIGSPSATPCNSQEIFFVTQGGGQAFFWSSLTGLLIDAIVVGGSDSANVYLYRPPVSTDPDLLVPPPVDGGARLTRIDFCVASDAGTDAGVDAGADARADAPDDASADGASDAAPSDEGGSKTW